VTLMLLLRDLFQWCPVLIVRAMYPSAHPLFFRWKTIHLFHQAEM